MQTALATYFQYGEDTYYGIQNAKILNESAQQKSMSKLRKPSTMRINSRGRPPKTWLYNNLKEAMEISV